MWISTVVRHFLKKALDKRLYQKIPTDIADSAFDSKGCLRTV
jgi:hypothetical protein